MTKYELAILSHLGVAQTVLFQAEILSQTEALIRSVGKKMDMMLEDKSKISTTTVENMSRYLDQFQIEVMGR